MNCRDNTTANSLQIAIAQIAPVWMNRAKTLDKIIDAVHTAGDRGCDLVAFGEALLPGYPFWIERTEGATFNSPRQKSFYSRYLDQSVCVEDGHLDALCEEAKRREIAVYLGCVERAMDRGGHSLYASLVYIDRSGRIQSIHRKLVPTYDERLAWSPGDGHGLHVHSLGRFTVGGLNCWENWMPLARAALSGLGEDLHIASWPGSVYLTRDITRFAALEGRSYVISASGLMRREDFPPDTPHLEEILSKSSAFLADGGSCAAGPDGQWILEPQTGTEDIFVVTVNHERVREERQNFDPVGHYSRPDVTSLTINRERQSVVKIQGS